MPDHQIEVTTNDIKQQRQEYAKSIVQPWRDGYLSKEYLDVHGTKGIKVTPEEVKSAQNVWTEEIDHDNFKRTK